MLLQVAVVPKESLMKYYGSCYETPTEPWADGDNPATEDTNLYCLGSTCELDESFVDYEY